MSMLTEEGEFNVSIVGATFEQKGNKGASAAVVTFCVDDTDKVIDRDYWFTDGAIGYSIDDLKSYGWTGEKMDTLEPETKGYKCSITTKVEVFKEKEYLKVQYVNPPKKNTDEVKAGMQASLDAYLGALAAQPNTDLDEDDDLTI